MSPIPPPYRPLRGAQPPHFADRADEDDYTSAGIVAGSLDAYTAGPADPRFHRLVYSGPAMGKTALLRSVGKEVSGRLGWAVVLHRCRPKERALGSVAQEAWAAVRGRWPAELGARLGCMAQHPSAQHPSAQHPSAQAWPRAAVPHSLPPSSEASWECLTRVMSLAGHSAQAISRGLLVMFDDADRLAGGEVESLGHLARGLASQGLPVAVLLSGGRELAQRFARARNFSGTVWPTMLASMDDAEAREALVVPATDRGVDFEHEAIELLSLAAGGSPLELQRLGFAAWSAAKVPGTIARSDAEDALGLVCPPVQRRAS
jgi:hypothetical protein